MVRKKEIGERKTKSSGKKLCKFQDSLKCGICGQKDHNSLICHRHKPPNAKTYGTKKSKAKAVAGSFTRATKANTYEAEMKRKNFMRKKAKQRAAKLKEKRDKKKVEDGLTRATDSSNQNGLVRKRVKCTKTTCSNCAYVQESQNGQ
ncbi:unnamed protein product [Prunus armeniaca]|uniref:Uncharacterized protein n=1 Tax=Prunus armeniaca TaxID=36596 RepID=A0A6J5TET3_PRUAR|nr:unnamed protein product [Prunus armeniaca]